MSVAGPKKAEQAGRPAVLLLDDDQFLLDMYSQKFSQAGFSVNSCFSVDEALALLRGGEQPDVILFDILMPNKDGFEFLRTLKEEKLAKGARLIALTNQSEEEERKMAEELGADRYVVKASLIPSEVVNMVQEEISKR
ncbi:response regulator [Candidatus Kaiserbacteria bacterium CG10_big_fil_rev_8_21_14_0_10_59_10]|uniref:Response regulator n=1 Tax=Candidatus Kaiserbacteria bacterium CG10_big_fil_rev_8_21_14_0_10_59_10 TaxID=1974612 RepID=A0A2H0U8N1_9BACT|nr:MAG: response regulator [Candidatus Kaiserbacteria bacterium CG10_big_fil_rev_8_21_14_0_10_59_10]